MPFAVQSRVRAEIETDRQCAALQVEVFEGQIDVVLFSQIEVARIQRSIDVGVPETDAGRHVVLEEITYGRVDSEDTAVQIQVVQNQQVVRIVARERAVRYGKPESDLTCVGEFDFVDFTVDSPFHRQESLFPAYRGNRGRHRCGRVVQIGVERRGRKFFYCGEETCIRSGGQAVLRAESQSILRGCRFLGSE